MKAEQEIPILVMIMVLLAPLLGMGGALGMNGPGTECAAAMPPALSAGSDGIVLLSDSGLAARWHYMTYDEMLDAKERLGVRDLSAAGEGQELRTLSDGEWLEQVGNQVILDGFLGGAPAAAAADLSTSPYFPKIGNQGNIGSCGAWAETYYQFGFLKAKQMGWTDASTGNSAHLFCPTWTYNKLNGGKDDGSMEGDNTRIIAQFGAATMDTMPYSDAIPEGYLDWGNEAAWRTAVQYRCQGYIVFEKTDMDAYIAAVKSAITNQIPVNFAINSTNMEENIADYNGNKNNIISSSEYNLEGSNHMQSVIGFDDSISDLDATPGAFKVANSYGAEFGISGFYYITYDAFRKMATWSETGIINMEGFSGYSPSALATFAFSTGPTRDANMSVEAVEVATSEVKASFAPAYKGGDVQRMPAFMCFDITQMSQYLNSSAYDLVLKATASNNTGTISSFKYEMYSAPYRVGQPDFVSSESADVPRDTPCSITAARGSGPSPPTPPQNVNAAAGRQLVNVTWSDPASDGGSPLTGFEVYYGTGATPDTLAASLPASAHWLVVTPLEAGTPYSFGVKAVNLAGRSAFSTIVQATPTGAEAPSAPRNLAAAAQAGRINLAWEAPASQGSSPVQRYDIFRGTSAGGEGPTPIGNVAAGTTSYQDAAVSGGQIYYYVVKAVNADGIGPASNEASATAPAPQPPGAPTNVAATPGKGNIVISWTAPSSAGSSPITGYKVYLDMAGGSRLIATVGAATLSYQDGNVTAGSTYLYHVTAQNAVGEGAASAQVSASPQSSTSADNTMLYVAIALIAVVVVIVILVVVRKKK
jgi:fibronectin type 3 domain-containing protein